MTTLDELLKGKNPSSFTARQLASKASWRMERQQFEEAFLLFDAAAKAASAEGDTYEWRCAENRASLACSRAGLRKEAKGRLEEVVEYFRTVRGGALGTEAFMAQYAACELIMNAPNEQFAAGYARLQQKCREGGEDFPSIHPLQEKLAARAEQIGELSILAELVERMRLRRPMPRKLKAQLDRWSDLVGG